ncbi:hypothetical protein [Mycolicibacterium hodleri]|nr:hypothetical protein [Mycolicibacterium hodleri]
MTEPQHLRQLDTWIRTYWPWLGLAAGIAIVVVGGIFFTPGVGP